MDLHRCQSLDFLVIPFGYKDMFAHVMLEFFDENGESIVLSVESRRTEKQKFSPLRGLFRQYGLIYIRGKPSDLITLRTDVWKNPV